MPVGPPPIPSRAARRALPAFVAAALTLLALVPSAAFAASTPTPERAIEMLNEWRAQIGARPVAQDPAQTDGCRKHANYYRLNPQTTGHYEDPKLPGYTPEGDEAAASSVLSYGGEEVGPYMWEAAVYHRTSILDPRLATTGFWSEFGLGCMGVFGEAARTEPALTFHPYPYDGQREIAFDIYEGESPDPHDNRHLGRYACVGLPEAAAGEVLVLVELTVDVDGLLRVSATELGTEHRPELRLVATAGLTRADVKTLRRSLAEIS